MTRGLDIWRKSFRRKRTNRSSDCNRSIFRLRMETLENRRLLATMVELPSSGFALDSSQHSAASLIVQFRDGASSAGSLGAYNATANVNPEWELTPGMRRVDLDPSADWAAALAAFQND